MTAFQKRDGGVTRAPVRLGGGDSIRFFSVRFVFQGGNRLRAPFGVNRWGGNLRPCASQCHDDQLLEIPLFVGAPFRQEHFRTHFVECSTIFTGMKTGSGGTPSCRCSSAWQTTTH